MSVAKVERPMSSTGLDYDRDKATEDIKKQALAFGADEVAIGNIERWEGAPIQMDPKQIMPECKSIIAMSFRVMRGSLRGIEEGTFFSNYSAMGYGALTYIYIPMTVINLSKYIEDRGYEALPMGHQSDWRAIDNEGFLKEKYSRPVASGRAAPDIMIHLRIAAYLSGLGEIGFSKMFLSPSFGPRCRIGIVLTDVDLTPDPIFEPGTLCNKCMACVNQCPGGCIPEDKTVKLSIQGKELEWSDIDTEACDFSFRGCEEREEVLSDEERYMDWGQGNIGPGSHSPFYKKPPNLYNTGQAVCGARGCTRACMISLESRGVLRNQFQDKFRRRKQWSVDWSSPVEQPEGTVTNSQYRNGLKEAD